MSPEDWKIVWSLFNQSLELPEDSRAAFVDGCGARTEVRARVAELLADDGSGWNGDGSPKTGGASATVPQENSELWVGPYRLVKVLGEGAMGTVYLAEQEKPLRRTVALKIVRPGLRGKELLERFEIERRVLAMMDHPNIARVYDAGQTADGRRPYFVMEYVAGVPITRHCDSHRLGLRERLELFITVCQGIQHAHQKGVIHRDIKPSNVLIAIGAEGRPTAKVIDFGVARAMETSGAGTLATHFGSIVGTVAYMSPDQAMMGSTQVDTRSDIYSLGVLAYELLVGETPMQTETVSLPALMERLRLEEPEAPSARARRRGRNAAEMAGEIDWIVMKALEKEPARRYQTAADLARDVQRYLHGDAVEAGPASRSYKLRRLAFRHRAMIATAAAFALVLICATAFSLRQAIRANEAREEAVSGRDQARRAEQEARRERDRAVAAEQRIRGQQELTLAEKRRADQEAAIARAVDEFLRNDLLSQASPFLQTGAGPNPNITVRQVLDRAAATLKDKLAGQPAIRASIEDTISGAYLDLGLFDQALGHADNAIALRRRPGSADGPDLLRSLDRRASALQGQGKYTEAEAVWKGIARVNRSRFGATGEATLATQHRLGMLDRARGRYRQAEQLLFEVLEARRRTLGAQHRDTLRAAGDLAYVYLESGRQPDAEKLQRKTYEAYRRLMGETHPDALASLSNLARAIHYQGRPAEAEPLYRKSLEGQLAVLGAAHAQTLATMDSLGSCLTRLGRADEAARVRTELIGTLSRERGPLHPSTLMANHNLAGIYQMLGQHGRALEMYRQCLEGQRKALGIESAQALLTMFNSATSMLYLGRYQEAVSTLQYVIATRRRVLGSDHPSVQMARSALGGVYAAMGRSEEAVAEAGEAWQLRRKRFGEAHFQTGHASAAYAAALIAAGRFSEARQQAGAAAAINRLLGDDHPDTIEANELIALADLSDGKPEAAARGFQSALEARARRFGQQHAPQPRTALLLALSQHSAGDLEGARRTVRQILTPPSAQDEPAWERALAKGLLGALLAAEKRFEDAEAALAAGLDEVAGLWPAIPAALQAEARQVWKSASLRLSESGRMASRWESRLEALRR